MSVNFNYSIPRRLTKEEQKEIRELGSDIKVGEMTARELKERDTMLASLHNPVSILSKGEYGTEISIGLPSSTDSYVPATPENMAVIQKIQEIILKKQ